MKHSRKLCELGEIKLIERIRERTKKEEGVIVGIGDDSAVLSFGGGNLLATSDLLIEGVHFYPYFKPYFLGWKALAVSLSDISAMGGEPLFALLSLSLPSHLSEEWLDDFLTGWEELAGMFNVCLVGGDMTEGEKIVIDSIVLGKADSPILRSGAKIHDKIFVTGFLGDSSAGLFSLKKNIAHPALLEKHLKPFPRVREGVEIGRSGKANAMIDLSDGLASDLSHICKESGKGALLFPEKFPLSPDLVSFCHSLNISPLEFALYGGEDYELLITGNEQLKESVDFPLYEIGEIIEGEDIFLFEEGKKRKLERKGFEHFKGKR